MNYSDLKKDNEGYLVDPEDWTLEIASQIAISEKN